MNKQRAILQEKNFLTSSLAQKQVMHLRLDVSNTDIDYQAGDILNIFAPNSDLRITNVLAFFNQNPDEMITYRGKTQTAFQWLRLSCEIHSVAFDLLEFLAQQTDDQEILQILLKKEPLAQFLQGKELIDVLRYFNYQFDFLKFLSLLKPLGARSYSISSSPLVLPQAIDLTVGLVSYTSLTGEHLGVASNYLEELEIGDEIMVEHIAHPSFKLPEDDKNIMMIGPGTGIAPFIGFISEREKRGASGRNWLIFGNRKEHEDFLYREQILNWYERGVINQLDLAFSRQQEHKIYVQHRLLEQQSQVWEHIVTGGYIFICGDAKRMAKDVDATLVKIVRENGMLDEKSAKKYLLDLRKQGRYVRDVY